MGNVRAYFLIATGALTACGSNSSKPDADVIIDASPDAKVFMDAPPVPSDFSCLGMAPPTTADDPISISGLTQSFTASGMPSPLPNVDVKAFKAGTASTIGMATSGADGAFT